MLLRQSCKHRYNQIKANKKGITMSLDKGLCWILIFGGMSAVIITILYVVDVIKNHKFQIFDCLIMTIGVAVGIWMSSVGMFCAPYTSSVEVTDAITVAKENNRYLVEKNGEFVDINHFEKILKHDDERYQLKTKIGYSMTGKEVSKTYTLVIPVDVIQEG